MHRSTKSDVHAARSLHTDACTCLCGSYIGVHFGHAIDRSKAADVRDQPQALVRMWGASIAACTVGGFALIPAFPVNKQLWTPSYALLNAAMTGASLVLVYLLCDVLQSRIARRVFLPFQWMGMNALLVFVFVREAPKNLPAMPCTRQNAHLTLRVLSCRVHRMFPPLTACSLASRLSPTRHRRPPTA